MKYSNHNKDIIRNIVTVPECILVGRFRACMKICLYEGSNMIMSIASCGRMRIAVEYRK